MDGKISIKDVSIQQPSGEEITHIGSIDFILDSALDYIDLEKQLESGEIIPKLQLKINHINADLTTVMNDSKQKPNKFEQFMTQIQAQGCGDIQSLNAKHLPELGYAEFNGSINVNFEYSKAMAEAKFNFDVIWHGMNAVYISTVMPEIYTSRDFANPDNKINAFKIDIEDLGYNERLIEFCSTKSDIKSEDYAKYHIEQLQHYLQNANITLSDGIYDAYLAYFVHHAKLSFNIAPKNAVNLQYINLYKTSDWAKILGLSLLVNGQKVDDLEMNWDEETALESALSGVAPTTQVKVAKHQMSYVAINPNTLSQYLHSKVKLETKLGQKYNGIVVKSSSNQIVVKIKLSGGSMEIPVDSYKITKAFVYK